MYVYIYVYVYVHTYIYIYISIEHMIYRDILSLSVSLSL